MKSIISYILSASLVLAGSAVLAGSEPVSSSSKASYSTVAQKKAPSFLFVVQAKKVRLNITKKQGTMSLF